MTDMPVLPPLGLPEAFLPLFENGPPPPDRIDAFLAQNAFPLVRPGEVVFAWHGRADRVELVRWIHAGGSRQAFHRMPGTDLWITRLAVEDGGRFEYKLAVGHDSHEELILDPLNRLRAGDPFGENSVCRTYGYERPDWTLPRGAPAGEVRPFEIDSTVFGQRRHEQIYLPHGYRADAPYPVVIIHDGQDYQNFADLSVSLDNLIADGVIPPILALLIQTQDRMGEYPGGRRHARYLVKDVMPVLTARYAVSADPADRVLLGASLGAVASISTAFRYPGVFGGLILKSGTFILDRSKLEGRTHPVFHRVARLVRALQRAPKLPQTRAFVSTGELEGLAEDNRALAEFLRKHGVDVLFKSAWDGHHWHNWRDQLRDGLVWTLARDNGG